MCVCLRRSPCSRAGRLTVSRGEARETEWTHEAIVIGVGQRAAFGSSAAAAPHTEVQAGGRGAARFGARALARGPVRAALRAYDGADLGPRDVGVAANLAKLAGGQTGGALVESVTAPLTMTQHGWDKLYAEYKESGE